MLIYWSSLRALEILHTAVSPPYNACTAHALPKLKLYSRGPSPPRGSPPLLPPPPSAWPRPLAAPPPSMGLPRLSPHLNKPTTPSAAPAGKKHRTPRTMPPAPTSDKVRDGVRSDSPQPHTASTDGIARIRNKRQQRRLGRPRDSHRQAVETPTKKKKERQRKARWNRLVAPPAAAVPRNPFSLPTALECFQGLKIQRSKYCPPSLPHENLARNRTTQCLQALAAQNKASPPSPFSSSPLFSVCGCLALPPSLSFSLSVSLSPMRRTPGTVPCLRTNAACTRDVLKSSSRGPTCTRGEAVWTARGQHREIARHAS